MSRRLALLSDHASPLAGLGDVDGGGRNLYIARLSQHLVQLGYQVDVFTRRDDPALPDVFQWSQGLRVVHVPAGPPQPIPPHELPAHAAAFTDFMLDFLAPQGPPFDLAHAVSWTSGLVAADLKAALGLPFVLTFQALDRLPDGDPGREAQLSEKGFELARRILRQATGILAGSPRDQAELVQVYDADPAKIREVPSAFDPRELWPVEKTQARERIAVPQDEWLVLQLGRLVPRKGVDTAIRGFAEFVRQPGVKARLLVVGGEASDPDPALNPEIDRLRRVAEEAGALGQVSFLGRRPRQDLKYFFSAADVFVSTPDYEPFGITPVESMACGTPVIGSSVGGIEYTVLDGRTGYLVPPEAPHALAARLLDLYQDPHRLARMREQSLRRADEFFTWEKVALKISALYHEIFSASDPMAPPLYEESAAADEAAVVSRVFESAVETLERSWSTLERGILQASDLLMACLERGNKVMVCGNGGSAAAAQHFSADLVGRFVSTERRGLPVIALTSDIAFFTGWTNEAGYDGVFSRQIEALGQPGDLLIGISTSGRSPNLLEAFDLAGRMQMETLALLGGDGGDLLPLAGASLVVPSWNAQRVQEVQILLLHLLCELMERRIQNTRWSAGRVPAFPVHTEGRPG